MSVIMVREPPGHTNNGRLRLSNNKVCFKLLSDTKLLQTELPRVIDDHSGWILHPLTLWARMTFSRNYAYKPRHRICLFPPLCPCETKHKTRGRKGCKRGTTRNFLHSFPLSGSPVVQSFWAWKTVTFNKSVLCFSCVFVRS